MSLLPAWTTEGVLLILQAVVESLLFTYVSKILAKLLVLQVLDVNLPFAWTTKFIRAPL
jgi:hypothetical protein